MPDIAGIPVDDLRSLAVEVRADRKAKGRENLLAEAVLELLDSLRWEPCAESLMKERAFLYDRLCEVDPAYQRSREAGERMLRIPELRTRLGLPPLEEA